LRDAVEQCLLGKVKGPIPEFDIDCVTTDLQGSIGKRRRFDSGGKHCCRNYRERGRDA
jgi:hypothetical protein